MEDLEVLQKRLLYHSHHRGMRELDLLLGQFAQEYLFNKSYEELDQFNRLLSYSDQDLYGWFFEKSQIPEEAPHSLIRMISLFYSSRAQIL